jgi:DNA-binding NtrC family response regulator
MAKRIDLEREASRDAEDAATANVKPPAFSPDGAILTVATGNAKGKVLALPGRVGTSVSIGKAPENDLVLVDDTVSRKHAVIERVPDGLLLRDLGSTNGVYVGGAQVKEALVVPGTLLQIGAVDVIVGVELGDLAIPASTEDRFGIAVGTSLVMRRIFGILERIASSPASVLLLGETGTGKDALARSIHSRSARPDGPYEVVDCGAVAPSLIESELFGHERGAFTGAVSARMGAFERAAGGTLFLDEVGELALDLQPKLLRILENREFRRVGGSKTIPADVRVIAATSRPLDRESGRRGLFRDDLYFRLAVVTIKVPALRQRIDDIPVLAQSLLRACDPEPRAELQAGPDVLAALKAYDWPGNVRELRNVLERALHVSKASGATKLSLVGFPPEGEDDAAAADGAAPVAFRSGESYREARARVEGWFEANFVRALLERHNGNVSAAARDARMDRNHLTDLARKHGIQRRG